MAPRPADTPELTGRKRRFEEMIAGHLPSLYRTALGLTRRREDAEDLVQDALVKAWRSLDGFREGENPRGWLTAILVNTYRDHYRRFKQAPPTTALETEDSYIYEGAVNAQTLGGANPEETVTAEELSDPVVQAIQDLPEVFRWPLLLVDLEGFHYQEAAEILGILTGTLMSRLHRARRRLGRALAGYGGPAPPGAPVSPRRRPGPQAVQAKRRAIRCGEACRYLHAYVDGLLGAHDTRLIDQHLATCRRCCDRLEFERRQRALLVAHHLGTPVPRAFVRRLQELVAEF
jgi:RNA polymerase sigma-70 factor (ECF subfamily)